MDVDHGLHRAAVADVRPAEAWPCKVIPLAVNVVQYPPPSGRRCFKLGQAIRRAVESLRPRPQRAGLGHRRHEPPAAGPARRPDQQGVGQRASSTGSIEDPAGLREMPHIEYVREAGSEGIELVMWLIMRGALGDESAASASCHRFYHVPASNTAVGHLVLENPTD